MVAVIKTTASIANALHYNENKLKQQVAKLIHSRNYGKDTDQLGFTDKIKTLEKYTTLNERTKLNAVHISLNFDPSEKLNTETLSRIADRYMQGIGFGNQPYLVYQHHDSGHPHIHIVTTNIQRDGKRIKMQNIGRNQSEVARRSIEKEFDLVKADGRSLRQAFELRPVRVQKVQYGRSETRRAITNVLDAVLPTYKYSSLPELNAILKQYNIVADKGKAGSRMHNSKGLLYRILDEKGQPIGIPIKASAIYNKPTLHFLEEKFRQNEPEKHRHKRRVKNAINLSFIRKPRQSVEELAAALQQERIKLVIRQNDKGQIYGMTYVDHQTKCVFNGSDLGKEYSSNAIQRRWNHHQTIDQEKIHPLTQRVNKPAQNPSKDATAPHQRSDIKLINELMQTEKEGNLAAELRQDQQKKKRKKLRH